MTEVNLSEVASRCGLSIDQVQTVIDKARKLLEPVTKSMNVKEGGIVYTLSIQRLGAGIIDTEHGKFWQYYFRIDDVWEEYIVIWKGPVDEGLNPVLHSDTLVIRTDSGCETGQVMGDRTCDCREQLHLAMEEISQEASGMIIHIPKQDGRGMGTPFKLATLYLQELLELNTVESATVLARGQDFDIRTYRGAIAILKFFDICSDKKIALATNNPQKITVFVENGYEIIGLRPVVVPATEQTKHHLKAKQDHLGHIDLIRKCTP